jgi:uncharacterized protein (TIGR02444 family)
MRSEPLWDWAVAAYARPGVPELCLDLQDGHEQNVPLLLFAAWTAATGRDLSQDALEEACDIAVAWERNVVKPLRVVRRALKGRIPDMADPEREAVRDEIKAVELSAERRLLQALESIVGDGADRSAERGAAIAPRLIATAKAWDRVVPRGALERLASKLSEPA